MSNEAPSQKTEAPQRIPPKDLGGPYAQPKPRTGHLKEETKKGPKKEVKHQPEKFRVPKGKKTQEKIVLNLGDPKSKEASLIIPIVR